MPEYFGRYELLELLGRGGMGEVYRAYDTERRREVALKLLPQHLVADEQFTARFRRESFLAAQLSEPHIVPIHDFGEIDGRLYLDMRIVEGLDLGSLLEQRGPLAPRIAVDIIRQTAAALDAAHERQLVHRDVKPSNIMLTSITDDLRKPPFAYLVDFGIARGSDQLTSLTETHSGTVGTLAYMAPERISGDEFDHRSDVYALACVLYETLTGSMPFQGDQVALMFAHMSREAPRPSSAAPGVPPALDDVVARGMAKDPAHRYATAGALADAAVAAVEATGAPITGPVTPPPTMPRTANPSGDFSTPTYVRATPPSGPTGGYGPPPPGSGYGPPAGGPPTGGPPTGGPPTGGPPTGGFPPGGTFPPTGGFPGPAAPHGRGWSGRRKAAVVAAVVVAAGVAVGVPLATAGGGGSGGGTGSPTVSGSTAPLAKGGTLTYTLGDTVKTWDPQTIVRLRDQGIATRLFARTLTQFGPDAQPKGAPLEPDLATDTGHASADGKTWSFTLKQGLTWEDGSPLTCSDVAYGISRVYDLKIDPTFNAVPFQLIDVAGGTKDGAYLGPWDGTGQALYDKAVNCSGQTITFHLIKPTYDFNQIVSLPAFAPVKKSHDKRDQQPLAIFSDGPYRLQAPWVQGTGGTFVRNDHYDPGTDDTAVRRALPDTIVVRESQSDGEINQQLFADTGAGATTVTSGSLQASALSRATNTERFTSPPQSFLNVLLPNFTRLKDPRIRQALAWAVDRVGYVKAQGGTNLSQPVYGIVPPWLGSNGGYQPFTVYADNPTGNASTAQSLLQQAGVKGRYPIRFVVRAEAPTSVLAGAKALAIGWDNAGFDVTVDALPDSSYGPLVEQPQNADKWDVTFLAWGPNWPDASTVIPAVFDSRENLNGVSNGADLGRYDDVATNAAIDKAEATADATSRSAQWAALDEYLAKRVAYIPLENPRFPRLHGSKVVNYTESVSACGGFPDLGQIGVKT